jgi:hypothetical protein
MRIWKVLKIGGAIAVVCNAIYICLSTLRLSSYQHQVEEIRAAEKTTVAVTTSATGKAKEQVPRNPAVKWQARYTLDENKDSYLQERIDFADELLKKHSKTDLTYEYLLPERNGTSDKNKDTEKWYVLCYLFVVMCRMSCGFDFMILMISGLNTIRILLYFLLKQGARVSQQTTNDQHVTVFLYSKPHQFLICGALLSGMKLKQQ